MASSLPAAPLTEPQCSRALTVWASASGGLVATLEPVFAQRYMTRFRCIADRCEDTCCGGMNILVSVQNRSALETTLSGSEAERAEFSANVIPTPEPVHGYEWMLARNDQGQCQFLQTDNLCSLICRFGPDSTADTCALFPRVFHYRPEALEVAGSLACPEAARLCLFAEDGTDFIEATEEILSRRVSPTPSMLTARTLDFDRIRSAMLKILRQRQYSLPVRLMQIFALGEHLDETKLDWHGVQTTAEAGCSAEGKASVVQALMGVTTGLLSRGSARYNQLVHRVVHTYQMAALEVQPALGQAPASTLWEALGEAVAKKILEVDRVLGAVLDPWLERYWVNDVYREPFTRSASLAEHAFQMLLRGALLKFLIVGHPVVDHLCSLHARSVENGGAAQLSSGELDYLKRAVIEAVQIFAKHIERDRDLLDLVDRQLSPESLGTDLLGRSRLFARFNGRIGL